MSGPSSAASTLPGPAQSEAAPERGAARRRLRGALGWVAVRVYPMVVIVGIWQLLTASGALTPFVLPPPLRVLERALLLLQSGELGVNTLITIQRVLSGYGLALLVGIGLGLLIGRSRPVRLALRPLVAYLFPTPKVAIYPAMLIILGFGTASKVALSFSEALFPILLATTAAASQVDPRLLWSARGLGTTERSTFFKVVLPAALPGILTGARIGLIGALVGTFLGEMIAGSDGLGHQMVVGWRLLRTADMYVAIVVISIIGFTLDRAFLALRARLLVWSDEAGH